MVLERKATGNEDFHTYKDGFGTLAEPSKMVSRIKQLSSFVGADANESVAAYKEGFGVSGTYQGHHCLVHNIELVNTSTTKDPYILIYDGRAGLSETASGGTLRLKMVMGNRGSPSSQVQLNFPIPLYLRNGWTIRSYNSGTSAVSAMIVNVNFTVLEHSGTTDVKDAEYKYLSTGFSSTGYCTDDDYTTKTTCVAEGETWIGTLQQVVNTDVEVFGCYSWVGSTNDYKTVTIENAAETDIGYHTVIGKLSSEDDLGQSINLVWYPYPLFCEGGLTLSNNESGMYSTVFYREVKSNDNTSNRRQMGF